MKIVVVHQYYLMPGMPGGSRFNELARMWAEAGHDVTVVAGTVDYTSGQTPERYRGKWLVEEQDGPVRVIRCHVPTTYGKGYTGRMWAFFGFTLSALSARLKIHSPDVVIATSPPLVAVIPGWAIARLRRRPAPWVFEIRDLWPESAVTTGVLKPDAALTKLLYGLERWAARNADRINVLTPAFRQDLVRRGLADDDKIVFVPNGADVERFTPGPRDNEVRRRHGWGDRFVVLYAGAHGRANALAQLVDAAALLRDRPDVLIACVGDGPERAGLTERARAEGLDNIVFLGAQPKDVMPDFVRACDVGAAVLQDNPTFRTVYPNKVFDYMACERPVLLAIDGVARELVCDEARAGMFVPPEQPATLAGAIRALADDAPQRAELGRNGRAWVLANATRESLAVRYTLVLAEVGASDSGGAGRRRRSRSNRRDGPLAPEETRLPKIRVNVGCGASPTPGWINLDSSPSVRIGRAPAAVRGALGLFLAPEQREFVSVVAREGIRHCNVIAGLPLADNSAEVIYSSHMLEHLARAEAEHFVRESYRVLEPGGILRIALPDLRRLVDGYLRDGDADRLVEATLLAFSPARSMRERAKLLIAGSRDHQWMYDAASLSSLLTRNKFADAKEVEVGHTTIPEPGALDLRERADESFYVEAIKPLKR